MVSLSLSLSLRLSFSISFLAFFFIGQLSHTSMRALAQAKLAWPPWPNGQGVGLLIRRLRARVPQGVLSDGGILIVIALPSPHQARGMRHSQHRDRRAYTHARAHTYHTNSAMQHIIRTYTNAQRSPPRTQPRNEGARRQRRKLVDLHIASVPARFSSQRRGHVPQPVGPMV